MGWNGRIALDCAAGSGSTPGRSIENEETDGADNGVACGRTFGVAPVPRFDQSCRRREQRHRADCPSSHKLHRSTGSTARSRKYEACGRIRRSNSPAGTSISVRAAMPAIVSKFGLCVTRLNAMAITVSPQNPCTILSVSH